MANGTVASPPPQPSRTAAPVVRCDQFIEQKLDHTQRQVKIVDVVSGLMILAVGTLMFLLAVAVLEHWVAAKGLPFGVRLMLWLGWLGVAGVFAGRYVLPPLVHRINPIYAAQTIEQHSPTLKNSLINFLLLRGHREEVAPVVFHAMEQRAAVDLSRAEIEMAVDRGRMVRMAYMFAGTVAVFALYLAISPKNPLVSAARVLWPWSNLAAPTRVHIDDVKPGDVVAYRGEKTTISADISGLRDGEEVTVQCRTADDGTVDQQIAMRRMGEASHYECTLPQGSEGLQQDVIYSILAGDAATPPMKIEVHIPPLITVDRVDYHYPAYTGIKDRTQTGLGDIKAIEGTRITIHASANMDIASARIDLFCTSLYSVPMHSTGRDATGEFTLGFVADPLKPNEPPRPNCDMYQVMFTSTQKSVAGDPLLNHAPVRYRIEVERDLPPEVQIIEPKEDDVAVAVDGQLPIRVRANDIDFALRHVAILAEHESRTIHAETLLDKPAPQVPWQGTLLKTWTFTPAQLGLKAGDVVKVWATADDNKEPDANHVPQPGQTPPMKMIRILPAGQAPPPADKQKSNVGNQSGKQGGEGSPDRSGKQGQNKSGENGGQSSDHGNQEGNGQPDKSQPARGDRGTPSADNSQVASGKPGPSSKADNTKAHSQEPNATEGASQAANGEKGDSASSSEQKKRTDPTTQESDAIKDILDHQEKTQSGKEPDQLASAADQKPKESPNQPQDSSKENQGNQDPSQPQPDQPQGSQPKPQKTGGDKPLDHGDVTPNAQPDKPQPEKQQDNKQQDNGGDQSGADPSGGGGSNGAQQSGKQKPQPQGGQQGGKQQGQQGGDKPSDDNQQSPQNQGQGNQQSGGSSAAQPSSQQPGQGNQPQSQPGSNSGDPTQPSNGSQSGNQPMGSESKSPSGRNRKENGEKSGDPKSAAQANQGQASGNSAKKDGEKQPTSGNRNESENGNRDDAQAKADNPVASGNQGVKQDGNKPAGEQSASSEKPNGEKGAGGQKSKSQAASGDKSGERGQTAQDKSPQDKASSGSPNSDAQNIPHGEPSKKSSGKPQGDQLAQAGAKPDKNGQKSPESNENSGLQAGGPNKGDKDKGEKEDANSGDKSAGQDSGAAQPKKDAEKAGSEKEGGGGSQDSGKKKEGGKDPSEGGGSQQSQSGKEPGKSSKSKGGSDAKAGDNHDGQKEQGKSGDPTNESSKNAPDPQADPQPGSSQPGKSNPGQVSDGMNDKPDKPQSPGSSQNNSNNNTSDTAGDKKASKGGGAGGGGSSDKLGKGQAGTQSSAPDGGSSSPEKGNADTGSEAGDAVKSAGQTGSEAKEKTNQGGQQIANKSDKPDPSSNASNSSNGSESSQPNNSNSASGKDGNKSAKQAGTAGGGQPAGGSAGANNVSTADSSPEKDTGPDAANLEFSKKQVDLALSHLKDQMKKDNSDLLKDLGWTKDDAQHFVDNWQKRMAAAAQSGPAKAEAQHALDESLRNLGLRPKGTQLKRGGTTTDAGQSVREAGQSEPPAEYSELMRQYSRATAGAGGQ